MPTIVEHLHLTSRWLNIVLGSLLLTFGLIGNCSTIYIFTRPAFRNAPSVRYLLASSMASLIQLLQTLLPRIIGDGFGMPIISSSSLHCQLRIGIAAIATLCAISYPCWAAFDHFVSTSRNAATRHYYTSQRFVSRAIFGTVLLWFLVYLPSIIFNRATGEICASSYITISYIYSYGLLPLTYTVLPIVTTIFFHLGIVRNLRRSRIINAVPTNSRLVKQVRRMLIPQLIILILSGIPFSIQAIYATSTAPVRKDPIRVAAENVVFNLVRLLFYLNYVCSFYIYMTMSSEVRREFHLLFRRGNAILPQRPIIHGFTSTPVVT